jgi:hypothetical protein
MEDDELCLSPLHQALFNKVPFFIISTFVDHWLLLEALQSLSEMQLVHLACIHNALYNVVHYLSSLFPVCVYFLLLGLHHCAWCGLGVIWLYQV